jgi:5'-nucleotidase
VTGRPLILLTNDDGIGSPGLAASARALAGLGDLLVAAPADQQTSAGRGKPGGERVGIVEERPGAFAGARAFAIHGSPALAVAHALVELVDARPAICVSGINYGENLGTSLTGSGTVGAALEAASFDVPALAVSLEVPIASHRSSDFAEVDWSAAMRLLRRVAARMLEAGLPSGVAALNLCVPAEPRSMQLRATRVSRAHYYTYDERTTRDRALPYHLTEHMGYRADELEPDDDVTAFAIDRVPSLTPLTLDLTAQGTLGAIAERFGVAGPSEAGILPA